MKEKIIGLFLLFSLVFAPLTHAETWQSISDKASQLKSIRATFIQEKHLRILAEPLISQGIFIFEAPDSLRWEYFKPVRSVMLMHDGKIKKYTEKNGKLVEEQGMSLESMQIVFGEINNWLKGHFNDNPTFKASLTDDHTILLTPKDKAIAQFIQKIMLKLSSNASLIDTVTIYEGSASFTRLTFQHPQINQELKSSLFTDLH